MKNCLNFANAKTMLSEDGNMYGDLPNTFFFPARRAEFVAEINENFLTCPKPNKVFTTGIQPTSSASLPTGHRERRQGERRRRRGRHAAAPGAPRLGRRAPLHRRGRGPGKTLAFFLQIFDGLVLGCIKTKFCKEICV